jgi:hypothetical protein
MGQHWQVGRSGHDGRKASADRSEATFGHVVIGAENAQDAEDPWRVDGNRGRDQMGQLTRPLQNGSTAAHS